MSQDLKIVSLSESEQDIKDLKEYVRVATSNDNTIDKSALVESCIEDHKNKLVDMKQVIQGTFLFACINGNLEDVKSSLKDKRIDPSFNNNDALRCATIKGHSEIVQLLLQDERINLAVDDN